MDVAVLMSLTIVELIMREKIIVSNGIDLTADRHTYQYSFSYEFIELLSFREPCVRDSVYRHESHDE
jgi:hypothetical protein